MLKHVLSIAVVAGMITLAGCGGGGSSSSDSTPSNADASLQSNSSSYLNQTGSSAGSVSAQFVAGSNTGFIELNSAGEQDFGTSVAPLVQAANGAVTSFSTFSLTGTGAATIGIAGDASFAMGQWNAGIATDSNPQLNPSITENLSNDHGSWNYVLYNRLSTLPTSGSLTCDTGHFTPPQIASTGTYTGATGLNTFGSATGTATLSFNATGANIAANIITTAGTSSGTASINGTLLTSNGLNGGLFPNHDLTDGVFLADGGNGAVNLIGLHQTTMNNGSIYKGLFEFTCK